MTSDSKPFPGKIAVVSSHISRNVEGFLSARQLLAKYGPEKVIHATWPSDFLQAQDQMIDTVAALAADMDIKILILNQAVLGSNAAVDKLKETRDDIFIVYCTNHGPLSDASKRADLVIMHDGIEMGYAMVKQAKKQGAKTFVHYSFPRHMALPLASSRRDCIQEACKSEEIQFVDAAVIDPSEETSALAAEQFILDDVPRMVAQYGEDTAFFCTNCLLQAPLIKSVITSHAIYPQPCCPSPYHGFPKALGIEIDEDSTDLNYLITEASRIAAEKNMTDRLSTWPVSAAMMFTNAGAEYAIKRLRGKAPKTGIDDEVLEKCMNAYAKEVVGEGVEVTMTSYSEGGVTYDNIKLILMGYLDF